MEKQEFLEQLKVLSIVEEPLAVSTEVNELKTKWNEEFDLKVETYQLEIYFQDINKNVNLLVKYRK